MTGRVPQPVRRFGRELVVYTRDHDLSGVSAELSYRLFLALFPFLILLVSLSAFIAKAVGVANPAHDIVTAIGGALPSDSASVLEREIDSVVRGRSAGLLSFGIVGTLWAASSGMGSVIKATNRAYGAGESRPFWRRSLLAIAMTASGGAGMLVASVVLVGAQVFSGRVGDALGMGNDLVFVVSILRFPVAMLVILFAVGVLYRLAPNRDRPDRWISAGAGFFTVTWVVMTTLFGIYASNFGAYNATYGALAGVAVLMVWLYLSSFLLLLGAEINGIRERWSHSQAQEM